MFIKSICVITLFLFLSSCQTVKKSDNITVDYIEFNKDTLKRSLKAKNHSTIKQVIPKALSWGGGGAFTHYSSTDDGLFLTSDVSGVWHKANFESQWLPLNNGLAEYEIVGLEVSSSGKIYLLSSRYLYELKIDAKNKEKYWQRISPLVGNKRNTVSKFTTTHSDNYGDSICLISQKNLLFCKLHEQNEWVKVTFSAEQKLRAIAFSNDGKALFVGLDNELYKYQFSSSGMEKIQIFESPIQMLSRDSSSLKLATLKGLYELTQNGKTFDELYTVNSQNIKRFICATSNNKCILSLEKNWTSNLFVLENENGIWRKTASKPKFTYDTTLPFRQWRRGLTKSLSLFAADAELEQLFFSDYWGAFYSRNGGKTWQEDVSGAVNTVGMDLLLNNNEVYVATMDNGVVKIDSDTKRFKAIYPLSDGKLAGHAWQLAANKNNLFFTFSPWNSKKNYVGQYNFDDERVTLINSGLPKSEKGKETFWGESYVRGIAATESEVLVTSDGFKGGLYTLSLPIEKDSATFTELGNWYKQQKIYNGLSVDNNEVQVASCNGTLSSFPFIEEESDFNVAETQTIRTKFCAFDITKNDNITYLLGEHKRKAIIVKVENGRQTTILETTYGSAFKALAINPKNNNELFAATISWSDKADSAAFFSTDQGKTWRDVSCLLTHFNGVTTAQFNDNGDLLYILQKVGGLIALPASTFLEIPCREVS